MRFTSMPKRSKFKNRKVVLGDEQFDSRKEAKRYQELKIMERAGLIQNLRQQVSYELASSVKFKSEPRRKPAIRYIADFAYMDLQTGQQVVEDVKSEVTRKLAPYRIKKHLMLTVHGIEITEV